MKKGIKVILLTLFLLTGLIFGHQPRIVSRDRIEIKNPEVSQAFYGELRGIPAEFWIHSKEDFKLYVRSLSTGYPKYPKRYFSTNLSCEGWKKREDCIFGWKGI
jgi:hypothetical protein